MSNEDYWLPNAVKQLRTSGLDARLLICLVADELDVTGVECIEDRVSNRSIAGPLSMSRGLRPKLILLWVGETLLNDLCAVGRGLVRACARSPRGTASEGLVDDLKCRLSVIGKLRSAREDHT